MTKNLIYLESWMPRPMSCPDLDSLVLLAEIRAASQRGLEEEVEDDALEAHVNSCLVCQQTVAEWLSVLGSWRDAASSTAEQFDATYFNDLAETVKSRINESEDASAPAWKPRMTGWLLSPPRLVLAAGVLAACFVALLQISTVPETEPGAVRPDAPGETLPEVSSVDALESEGLALGRELLASLLSDEETDVSRLYGPLLVLDTTEITDDFTFWLSPSTLFDELDELDSGELNSLFTTL